jgi:hypothetical protein
MGCINMRFFFKNQSFVISSLLGVKDHVEFGERGFV